MNPHALIPDPSTLKLALDIIETCAWFAGLALLTTVIVLGIPFLIGAVITAGRCSDEEARSARWPE